MAVGGVTGLRIGGGSRLRCRWLRGGRGGLLSGFVLLRFLFRTAAVAVLVLVVAVTLSVYKPKGLTCYGWRRQHESRARQRLAFQDPAVAA